MSNEGNAPASQTTEEHDAVFLDILREAPLFGHRKSRSLVGSYCYIVLVAGYVILAAVAPWILCQVGYLVPLVLCSCDVAFLIITGIFQQHFVNEVLRIRLQGYYSFSQKLKHFVRVPFAVMAYGTAAMLLVMIWRPYISILSISMVQRIIMLVEAICAASFVIVYMGYMHRYNSVNSQPDVLKSLYSPLLPSPLEGLRYHESGRLLDQQMALLQYQRENLQFLSEEILRLQECLNKYEDGSITQVDLVHLLAARDQEIRTLSTEMCQLHSELDLARSLITNRERETQHVSQTNDQYVTENERLRAILGEWSRRTAKLERTLEVERVSNHELQNKLTALENQSHEISRAT